jgi:hypothetical protein
MEHNTPETQPFPQGNPADVNPIQDIPLQDGPNRDDYSRDDHNRDDQNQNGVAKPARPKGPNAAPLVLGLVALAIAALIIANETTGLRVDWSRLGPGAIVGVGALLVVLGAIGLVRRHDDG